jgi:hypothetical protein
MSLDEQPDPLGECMEWCNKLKEALADLVRTSVAGKDGYFVAKEKAEKLLKKMEGR